MYLRACASTAPAWRRSSPSPRSGRWRRPAGRTRRRRRAHPGTAPRDSRGGPRTCWPTRGYPTTWGAAPFEDQVLDEDATVVRRLDEAGAVLVAKLTLGALAQGDEWFGGRTRNPWDPDQGSSGSSAGPAAATVAGLVGFSIGSRDAGLHRVPLHPMRRQRPAAHVRTGEPRRRHGPVLDHGQARADLPERGGLRPGPPGHPRGRRRGSHRPDASPSAGTRSAPCTSSAWGTSPRRSRPTARVGLSTRPRWTYCAVWGWSRSRSTLPDAYPLSALRIILNAEAAAAFDELTRSGRDDLLVRQTAGSWPNSFRTARLIPAVEYIQANRVRTLVMRALDEALRGIDVLVTPSFGGGLNDSVLLMTNLTGPSGGGGPRRIHGEGHAGEHLLHRPPLGRGRLPASGQGLPGRDRLPPEGSAALRAV